MVCIFILSLIPWSKTAAWPHRCNLLLLFPVALVYRLKKHTGGILNSMTLVTWRVPSGSCFTFAMKITRSKVKQTFILQDARRRRDELCRLSKRHTMCLPRSITQDSQTALVYFNFHIVPNIWPIPRGTTKQHSKHKRKFYLLQIKCPNIRLHTHWNITGLYVCSVY